MVNIEYNEKKESFHISLGELGGTSPSEAIGGNPNASSTVINNKPSDGSNSSTASAITLNG